MAKKIVWLNAQGKFAVKSCKAIEAFLLHETAIQAQVHKTDRYLVINYCRNNALNTAKVEIPGCVLYCLKEDDFKPLLAEMRAAPPTQPKEGV